MEQQPPTASYALWLTPSGQAYRYLTRKILAYSRRHSTPRFEPHVTLLSGVTLPEEEAKSRSTALAARLAPFEIRLGKCDYTDEYFRCLFYRLAPSVAVADAQEIARQVFGLCDRRPYLPHLSLIYGNLSIEVKRRLAAGLSGDLSFAVSRIHLYSVSGPPPGWRSVGTYTLY